MHFQLYFPGVTREDHALLEAIQPGLSAKTSWFKQDRGPDGGSGMHVSWDGSMYVQDACRWVPAAADPEHELAMGRYLLGVPVAKPCTPRELAWWKEVKGPAVRLGDENEWVIPSAGRLPQALKRDPETGNMVSSVKAIFEPFYSEACDWYVRLLDADNSVEAPADYWRYALLALRFNYRMPPELMSELELIDSQTFLHLVLATLDGLQLRDPDEFAKKKMPAA